MTQLMKSHPGMVEEVISMLRHMEIDGETMQYILKEVAMEDQMLKQLINKNVDNGYIIKKENDNEYVTYNDKSTQRWGGYSITHNRNSAKLFKTKKDAIDTISKYNLELHLMTNLVVEKF